VERMTADGVTTFVEVGPGKVLLTLNSTASNIVSTAGFYLPPNRNWGFDGRFSDLRNMPPGTPFLTTPPTVSWSELK